MCIYTKICTYLLPAAYIFFYLVGNKFFRANQCKIVVELGLSSLRTIEGTFNIESLFFIQLKQPKRLFIAQELNIVM